MPETENAGKGQFAKKWVKRIAIAMLSLLVALAAALYVLYFHRASLPAAAPHARVAATFTPLAGISACWVETGRTFSQSWFGSTGGGVLVRHPAGDLLIDAGNSSHFDKEIRGYPFWTRLKVNGLAGQLKADVPIPEVLRLMGEDPARLRWVILSHAHLDHAGGLMDLPRVRILLTREEIAFARDPKVQAKGYVNPAHARLFPSVDQPTLSFAQRPYEIFERSADLYGDGSVVVVPLRGHTPGSVGIFVNLAPGRRLFYVGDAVDDERGFAERVGKSFILRDSDNDEQRANEIVAKLSLFHQMAPEIAILPAHGRSAYKKFFPRGPLSCVTGQ
jgi:N-acyl homoserine lactone hydrolase